jgi:hypothetical protein
LPGAGTLVQPSKLKPNLLVEAMTYQDLCKETEALSYRDKFRLAQHLIQLARKEEEEENPERRQSGGPTATWDPELIEYVSYRLHKLKPSRRDALLNSIGAMFQFQGGISEVDKERMCFELQKRKHIEMDQHGHIHYPGR